MHCRNMGMEMANEFTEMVEKVESIGTSLIDAVNKLYICNPQVFLLFAQLVLPCLQTVC